ncbi:unnamed protein product [Phytomonas sp. Hart1]|nr:unnamed protein product [Phytomonas sp. Hart1]|eukprot:CCW71137.1 unnamed protein product [Phytomonas sp. isolate Hart1]
MKDCSIRSKRTQAKSQGKKPFAIAGRLPPIDKFTESSALSSADPSISRALVCLPKVDDIHAFQSLIVPFQVKEGDCGAANKVSLWPFRGKRGVLRKDAQDCPRSSSKAPLSLQLEAFIRKEHRQYLIDHPDCSRLNTLHIFREGLSAFVEHFKEYKPVLSLIREEYDLTIKEVTDQMTRMGVENLENKSDRSVHAMELIQLKESLNATIRNQEAQLRATLGMVHSLRDQLSASEKHNAQLKLEMEQKLKGFEEAQGKITMFSKSLIDENSRTAEAIKASTKKDSEIKLLNSRIKVLAEEVNDLKDCLGKQTRARMGIYGSLTRSHITSQEDNEVSSSLGNSPISTEANYTSEYVHRLITRIDGLEGELAIVRNNSTNSTGLSLGKPVGSGVVPETPNFPADSPEAIGRSHSCLVVKDDFPIIREWFRLEGIGEAELESSDTLLPPGLCQSEELAFLKACAPVKNRRFRQDVILKLIEDLWDSRERQLNYSKFQNFFIEWLTAKSGCSSGMKELGVNFLQGCQRNSHHPDCRVLLQILRGFLPEELVRSCRQQLRMLFETCRDSTELLNGEIPISVVSDIIRSIWPEKYHAHMLQLRFYAYRHTSQPDKVNIDDLFSSNSYFVTMLKSQYFREVEEFTLSVVEKVRMSSIEDNGMISVAIVIEIIKKLDDGLTGEIISRLLSNAFKKTIVDILSSDVPIRVDDILHHFRSSILLRRVTPPD